MIINFFDIEIDTLKNIIRENILRDIDSQDMNIAKQVDIVLEKIKSGSISIVYSQFKNDVTLVDSKLLKK